MERHVRGYVDTEEGYGEKSRQDQVVFSPCRGRIEVADHRGPIEMKGLRRTELAGGPEPSP